jgi:hypothetical protein
VRDRGVCRQREEHFRGTRTEGVAVRATHGCLRNLWRGEKMGGAGEKPPAKEKWSRSWLFEEEESLNND